MDWLGIVVIGGGLGILVALLIDKLLAFGKGRKTDRRQVGQHQSPEWPRQGSWHPIPGDPGTCCWWDGYRWTEHYIRWDGHQWRSLT
jgi:hypothetical protein